MAELHYISAAQAAAAERAPLEVNRGSYYSQRNEHFFFEYVRERLIHRYGARMVKQGGLKVYTTINLNIQRLARKAIAEVLNEPEDPAAAVVTLNPRTAKSRLWPSRRAMRSPSTTSPPTATASPAPRSRPST